MWSVFAGALTLASLSAACTPSETIVGGTHAPAIVCSGDVIFSEDFDELNTEKWRHENTLSGGGNWEFQYYSNNHTNSFTHNGRLYIRPSLTADQFGEWFLYNGFLKVEDGVPGYRCTNWHNWGCERQGSSSHVLNPVKSASLGTINSFNFRYGKVEVRAKMPAGDWMWPTIKLMPAADTYGIEISSGAMVLVESRGNKNLLLNDSNIGTQEVSSTLHYGPDQMFNGWERAHWLRRNESGYNSDFHRYQLEWTSDYIQFSIDDVKLGRVTPGDGGFWEHGGFRRTTRLLNPWQSATKMAPFDQKFFVTINLAVGGTNGYFPDGAKNPTPKPWSNDSPAAYTQFWEGRANWLPTWDLAPIKDDTESALQIDYVRVWAL